MGIQTKNQPYIELIQFTLAIIESSISKDN